jgi:hypothetical protein
MLILLSALGLASVAAYFSIVGIAGLFSGAIISVSIMAFFLELGKIVSVSFVYRYWKKINSLYKVYFVLAVLILTTITSGGIGAFLLSAFSTSSLSFKLNQDKIVMTESSKGYYTNQIVFSEDRIKVLNEARKVQESRLSDALTNVFLVRNPIQLQQLQEQTIKMVDQANTDIKAENDKVEQARGQLQTIDGKISQMKIGSVEKKDIQTFKFLADALHTDLDTIAKWFIISLIFVFDPLAIALILAYNVVTYRKEDEKVKDTIVEPKVELPEVIKKENPVIPENPIDIPKIEKPIETPLIDDSTKNNKTEESKKKYLSLDGVNPSNIINKPNIPIVSSKITEMNEYYRRMFKF